MSLRALFVIICTALFTTIRSQSVHPPQGIQLGNPPAGINIIIPASMTQCESFLVYYNITLLVSPFIAFYTPDLAGNALLTLLPPASATGYIDWMCNIPADHGLIVGVRDPGGVLRTQNFVVQPGTSSSCLVDLTAIYTVAGYGINFPSYTSAATPSFRTIVSMPQGSTTDFPTAAISTITANPDLFAVNSSTFQSQLSTSSARQSTTNTPTPTASSTKRKTNVALALGIVGGILFMGLLTLLSFCWGRHGGRRKKWVHDSDPTSVIVAENMHNIRPEIGLPGHRVVHSPGHIQFSNLQTFTDAAYRPLGRSASIGTSRAPPPSYRTNP